MAALGIADHLHTRYPQPKGVEQFGIRALSEQPKTAEWRVALPIVLDFLVNPAAILSGGLALAS